MAIDSLVNMQQMFGSPTPDPVGQSLQAGLGQQRAVISNNIAQDKLDKNQKLSLMLYALGGALKGDENFVQNTIKIQQMQEGKKKEKAKKAKYDDFIKGLPEGSFKDLTKSLGPDRLDELLLKKYEAETREPKKKSVGDFKAEILAKIERGETLTSRDQEVLDVIKSTDPIEVAMRRSLDEMGLGMDTTIETPNAISTQEEYNALPVGAKYISNGIEYIKGE